MTVAHDRAWLGVWRSYAAIGPRAMREKAALIVAEIEARLVQLDPPKDEPKPEPAAPKPKPEPEPEPEPAQVEVPPTHEQQLDLFG